MNIDRLVIIAAPSGAGKSTLSAKIIDGLRLDYINIDYEKEIIRFDSKKIKLSNKEYNIVIIEQALNKFKEPNAKISKDVLDLIRLSNKTYIITMHVKKEEIGRRYIKQIFNAVSRKTPVWMRLFQVRKWMQYLNIIMTDDIEKKYSNWNFFTKNIIKKFKNVKHFDIDHNYNLKS